MPHRQTGAEQFKDWIARRFPNSTSPNRDAAELFGWDPTFISQLCTGRRSQLRLVNAVLIEDTTGIPVRAWLSSELDGPEPATAGTGRKRRQDRQ